MADDAAANTDPMKAYADSIDKLKTFIGDLTIEHDGMKGAITAFKLDEEPLNVGVFADAVTKILQELQEEKFEGTATPKYPHAQTAVEQIEAIKAAVAKLPQIVAVDAASGGAKKGSGGKRQSRNRNRNRNRSKSAHGSKRR